MYFFSRPFERTLTLHKDSTGHVGFQFSSGKITAIVVDSSAARNGLLIEHNLLEVGAIILILQCSYSYTTSYTMGKKFIKNPLKLYLHNSLKGLKSTFFETFFFRLGPSLQYKN